MKNIFKKAIAAGILLAITGSLAAFASTDATRVDAGTLASEEKTVSTVLKVGANITPHAEILEVVKESIHVLGGREIQRNDNIVIH